MGAYILFFLMFFSVANWRLLQNWFRRDGTKSNNSAKKITDDSIRRFIFSTTNIKIDQVYIAPSDALFAFCGGFTKKPLFVISRGAYKAFTGDAREWLVLHEIAHYVLGHTLSISTVQLAYALLGYLILSMGFPFPIVFYLIPLLSIGLGICTIQTNKIFDIYANNFAVKRMKRPLGMKHGAQLFIKQAQANGVMHDTLLMTLFYPWNYAMWRRTIRDAEKEYEMRQHM